MRIDGNAVVDGFVLSSFNTKSGHALLGTAQYGHFTQFDNFNLVSEYTSCGGTTPKVGTNVSVVVCGAEVGPQPGSLWRFNAVPNVKSSNSTISLRSDPSLCLSASGANSPLSAWWLSLQTCDATDPSQQWSWSFDGIAPDVERSSFIYLAGANRCIDILNQQPDIGAVMDAWPCNLGANQAFFYDHDAGEIANEATSTCLGIC